MTKPRAFCVRPTQKHGLLPDASLYGSYSRMGWRTRTVDHATASILNPVNAPGDRGQHDTVEYQRTTRSAFMRLGPVPNQWKRYRKQAFMTCAIAAHHLQFASVVFMFMGTLWVSEHRAVFFGATSAVYAWHRVGHFMTHVLRGSARCPVGR